MGRNLGLSQNDRDVIRQERITVNDKLEAVLNKWIEKEKLPQWETLIAAIRGVGLISLAESIKTKCV